MESLISDLCNREIWGTSRAFGSFWGRSRRIQSWCNCFSPGSRLLDADDGTNPEIKWNRASKTGEDTPQALPMSQLLTILQRLDSDLAARQPSLQFFVGIAS
jgi:hypothetical protein